MPDLICAYENCHETDTPTQLTINDTDPKVRVRFCSLDHLIAWATNQRDRWAIVQPSTIPEWMTPQQVEAIGKLHNRSADGSPNRHEFFSRVQECGIGSNRYAGITWCGMFVAVEADGFIHT